MLKIASAVLVMAETEFLIYRNLHINFRLMYYNQSTVRKMYNILLVEDDKNIREMLVEYFSKRDKDKFNIQIFAFVCTLKLYGIYTLGLGAKTSQVNVSQKS